MAEIYGSSCKRPVIAWSESDDARRNGYITYNLAPGEELITCPYIESHRVLSARYARHLVKCRANYLKEMQRKGKKPEYKICRFNYKHHFPEMEMTSHEQHCPDSASVVDHLQKYPCAMAFVDELKARAVKFEDTKPMKHDWPGPKVNTTVPDPGVESNNHEEESWDDEVAENLKSGNVTYNPKIKLAQNQGKIIQSLGGITTKSERKEFRETQREAFRSRGGDFGDEVPETSCNGQGPSQEPQKLTDSDIRLKRARELAIAQKNATLMEGHLNPMNRKRRSDQALEQINSIISLAQSEQNTFSEHSMFSDTASGISSAMSDSTM